VAKKERSKEKPIQTESGGTGGMSAAGGGSVLEVGDSADGEEKNKTLNLDTKKESEDMQFEQLVKTVVKEVIKEAMYSADDIPNSRVANTAYYVVTGVMKAFQKAGLELDRELKRDIIEGINHAYTIGQEEAADKK